MLTTVDLPHDLHEQAQAIARDTRRTSSATAADLVRRGLAQLHTDVAVLIPGNGAR